MYPDEYEWEPQRRHFGVGFAFEEELSDQIAKFPTLDEIEEIIALLRVATLRELSIEIVNAGIEHVRGNTNRVEYAKFTNSWLATAEETVAAGRNVSKIAARRRKKDVED